MNTTRAAGWWTVRRTAIFFALIVSAIFLGSVPAMASSFGGEMASDHVALPSAAVAPHYAMPSGPLGSVQSASPVTQPGYNSGSDFNVVPTSAPLPKSMTVLVSLTPSANLNSYAAAIQQPGSPTYNDFLTNHEVGQYFGASSTSIGQLTSYFSSYGLNVLTSPNDLSMQVSGSTPALQSAFHTHLAPYADQYRSQGAWVPTYGVQSATPGTYLGAPFFANTIPLSLPQSLTPLVNGVVGFDGVQATPDLALPAGISPSTASAAPAHSHPQLGSSDCALQLPSVDNCLTPQQAFNDSYGNYTWFGTNSTDYLCFTYDLCNIGDFQMLVPGSLPAATGAYNLWSGAKTLNGLPDEGQGITLAVVEVGCIQTTTLGNFSTMLWGSPNQLLDRFTEITTTSNPGEPQANLGSCDYNGTIYGWNGETALDIEYMAAMAPEAHIDLVATSDAEFSSFDQVYADIAAYMSTGAACSFPTTDIAIVYGTGSPAACSISITSNSYGSGEIYVGFAYGSPLFLTVENQLIETMAVQGITNFFASGDYAGGAAAFGMPQADMPGIATGSITVGGGQLTVAGPDGNPFPSLVGGSSGEYTAFCLDNASGTCTSSVTVNVTQTLSIFSYTFWGYSAGFGPGTYVGVEGGGHGLSYSLSQPWWQIGNDTYSSGARIDPVVSGSAAFNMSIYAPANPLYGEDEGWELLYGGTSFATPITAGEWALIEEQYNLIAASSKMGDISALLYWLHDAFQAGVGTWIANPYQDMQYEPQGFDSSNWDSYNWYYTNLSVTQPTNPNSPNWENSIDNTAGPGWNFLQGLGLFLVGNAVPELVGSTSGHTFGGLTSGMAVEEVVGASTSPVTSVYAGAPITFQVVYTSNGTLVKNVNIWAYSGGANQGTYGGGTVTFAFSPTGTFSWTPTWGANGLYGNYSEYGYFLIGRIGTTASGPWLFNAFSVAPARPAANSQLTLTVYSPLGPVSSGSAEITSFYYYDAGGYYNLGGQAQVSLNGRPVAGAIIQQSTVSWLWDTYYYGNPFSGNWYTPGAPLDSFYSDSAGQFIFWADAWTAETNGVVPTNVFTLQATYDGLTSANITVFVEPQSGYFSTSGLSISYSGGAAHVVGDLSYYQERYLGTLNVSIGASPGEYQLYDCANWPAFCPVSYSYGEGYSNAYTGQVPVDLTIPAAMDVPGQPIWVNANGNGNSSLTFTLPLYGYTFVAQTQPNWNITFPVANDGPDPTAILTTSPTGPTVWGTVTLTYAGTWALGVQHFNGAVGTVSIRSAGGTTVVATGLALVNNGTATYTWNTATVWPGYYWVNMTVVTPTGLTATATSILYVTSVLAVTSVGSSPAASDAGVAVTLSAFAHGGVLPYTYSWYLGDGSWSSATSPSHKYAVAATYDVEVWVNDSTGQSVLAHGTVVVNADPSLALSASATVEDYSASSTTTVAANPSGGTAPFTYVTTGLPAADCSGFGTAAVVCTGLPVGTYVVNAWANDSVGKNSTNSVTITVNPTLGITTKPSATEADFSASSTWTLTAAPSGGTSPYTYSYTGLPAGSTCAGTSTATVTCSGLPSGTYTIVAWVKDGAGARVSNTTVVMVNPALTVALSAPTADYTGTSVSIATAVTGGSPGYTFSYAGLPTGCSSSSSAIISCDPQAAGTFTVTVTVTDAASGTQTATATIDVSAPPTPAPSGLLGTSGSSTWLPYALIALLVVAVLLGFLYLRERGRKGSAASLAGSAAAGAGAGVAGGAMMSNDTVSPTPPPPGDSSDGNYAESPGPSAPQATAMNPPPPMG